MSKTASETTTAAEYAPDRIVSRVGEAIGEGRAEIVTGRNYRVGSEESRVVVTPRSQEELAETLRLASGESWSVIPAGAGTWLEVGNRPRAAHLVVSTARLDRVLEYEPADLTATIEAGCPLDTFNGRAREHGQWIPLDPFGDRQGTIGATIATGSCGPLRCGYGSPRDWLIGIRVAQIDGRMSRAGGKVVKNVAGYDLCKLYTGSFGTLAIITEMTFKLRSLASAEKTIAFRADRPAPLTALAAAIHASPLQPSAMELLSPGVPGGPQWTLAVRFLHEPEAVASQAASVTGLATSHDGVSADEMGEEEAVRFWRELHQSETDEEREWQLRMTMLPSDLSAGIGEAAQRLPGGEWRAHAASGVLRFSASRGWLGEGSPSETLRRLRELRQWFQSRGGQMVILRAPEAIGEELDAWGDPGPTLSLMRSIKEKFDPHSLLNPGRFVAGI